MTTSSIFLTSVTVVDHAYIDPKGVIRGMSYNPTFVVTGSVDDHENVVIDFSSVKKELKALIDHPVTGFDHKLWCINTGDDATSSKCLVTSLPNSRLRITTPCTELEVPEDAVRKIDLWGHDSMNEFWSQYLTNCLGGLHPGINVKVEVNLGVLMTSLTGVVTTPGRYGFSYTHGLKNSTSFGCQNIAHGHLSYIQLLKDHQTPCDTEAAADVLRRMAYALADAVFVWDANLGDGNDRIIAVEYTSANRGRWYARYDKQVYNVRVLKDETTIEHLVEYAAQKFKTDLQLLASEGAKYLAISEGLTKGAVLDLNQFFLAGSND